MNKDFSIAVMYAITPCHAGSGSALGVVDLPIQREKHSNWPVIQASGVKGAFRANFERYKNNIPEGDRTNKEYFNELSQSIFGTDDFAKTENGKRISIKKDDKAIGGFAGSSSFSDARILAYPMRSSFAPFVWITCPSVLKRLVRDLEFAGNISENVAIPEVKDSDAICLSGDISGDVLLEDFEVSVKKSEKIEKLADYLESAERLLLVSDNVFNYGVTDCTQIMAQIKIDEKTGTTKDGSLRYQEELPSDTIMYTVIHWGDSKNSLEGQLKADTIKKYIKEQVINNYIQIAGDETCGRGIFKIEWK